MPDSNTHTFPAAHALQVVTLMRRFRVQPGDLLRGTGLCEADLEAPNLRIASETLKQIYERARTLSGEPAIGVYLGLQKRPSMYGFVGFAAMNARTLREGLELMIRYAPTLSTALTFELVVDGHEARFLVHEHADMGSARDIAVFSFAVGSRQLTTNLLGLEPSGTATDIPLPRPGYFDRFAHLLPDARFDRPQMALGFDARALSLPLVSPDPAALNLARETCERQLAELGFDQGLVARVRRAIVDIGGGARSGQVALALHMSERTLARRLADEGTSYTAIVDDLRQEQALELLRSPNLSLDEIAQKLGYRSTPNFARAFRRWMGLSPGQYRTRGR